MSASLMITYHDELGFVELVLTEYPEIVCDGQYIFFTDDEGEDYKLSTTEVDRIEAINY